MLQRIPFKKNMIQCKICGKFFNYINNSHLKTHNITPREYKEKYGEIISKEFKNNMRNSKIGHISYNKGKKFEEQFGNEKAKEYKQKISNSVSKDWNKYHDFDSLEKCGKKLRKGFFRFCAHCREPFYTKRLVNSICCSNSCISQIKKGKKREEFSQFVNNYRKYLIKNNLDDSSNAKKQILEQRKLERIKKQELNNE